MAQGLGDLSLTLAARLRDLARMHDRLDRLESGTGEWLTSQEDGDWDEAATEMALRALRVVADPANFRLLSRLVASTTAALADLESELGLGRLPTAERVNDLVQVGLAAHNIDTGQVQATPGGAALVRLVQDIAHATGERLKEAVKPVTQ